MKKNNTIYRYEIYYADLSPVIGSEQGGVRPVVIIQNDVGNKHSPTTIVAPITSQYTKAKLPTHVALPKEKTGLRCDSTVLLEQIRCISKERLKDCVGVVNCELHKDIDKAIAISLGLA